jgi:hypothetical protein
VFLQYAYASYWGGLYLCLLCQQLFSEGIIYLGLIKDDLTKPSLPVRHGALKSRHCDRSFSFRYPPPLWQPPPPLSVHRITKDKNHFGKVFSLTTTKQVHILYIKPFLAKNQTSREASTPIQFQFQWICQISFSGYNFTKQ